MFQSRVLIPSLRSRTDDRNTDSASGGICSTARRTAGLAVGPGLWAMIFILFFSVPAAGQDLLPKTARSAPSNQREEVTASVSTPADPVATAIPLVNPQGDRLPDPDAPSGAEVSAIPKKFQYALRLGLRGVYDDNIFLRQFNRVSDFYFAIEPGITLGYGDIVGSDQNYIRFDYAPSAFLYADHSEANALQHIIRLDAQYHFRRLSLTLSEEIQILDGANFSASAAGPNPVPAVNLDAGGDTSVNTFNTRANFSYDLTGKTFLSGGVQHTANEYESNLIASSTIQGNLYINYNYSPKLVVGLGGTAGYNWVDSASPNQTFEQINGRLTYQLSGKVNLDASGGVEFRQFEGDARSSTYVSPVYEIGANYQPFDGTSLSLRGSRRTQNSAVLAGQDYASTDVSVSMRQRFFQRVYLSLSLGYQNLSYFSTLNNADASRDDDYFYLQPALDFTLTRYWTLGLYYLHRENETSAASFGFDDNQFGLRTSLAF